LCSAPRVPNIRNLREHVPPPPYLVPAPMRRCLVSDGHILYMYTCTCSFSTL